VFGDLSSDIGENGAYLLIKGKKQKFAIIDQDPIGFDLKASLETVLSGNVAINKSMRDGLLGNINLK
jgi:hypothetical protein